MRWLTLAGLVVALLVGLTARASDHADAPLASADPAADLADFYAWQEGTRVICVLTWSPFQSPGDGAVFDDDVLYSVFVDTDGDQSAETIVRVRFGQNGAGDWGVRFEDVPGMSGDLVGPVETELSSGGLRAWAGVADDPFFFDLQGFVDTLSTGTIGFDSTRDAFAGANVTALVFEMDSNALGSTTIDVWATSRRW